MNVLLTEDDVPGAKLKHSNIEDNNKDALQRWLTCRNLPKGGLKVALVKRVRDCIDAGNANNIFVGVDGGIWYDQKCRELLPSCRPSGSQNTTLLEACVFKKFPSVSIPRSFSLPLITEWLVNENNPIVENDSEGSEDELDTFVATSGNTKAIRRGRLSFRSGHVTEMQDGDDPHFYYIKANVIASYKKVIYVTHVILRKDSSQICDAGCTCKAATSKSCSHIAALLFALEDYTLIFNFDPPTSTSLLKTWNVGRKIGNNPQVVTKAEYATPRGLLAQNRERLLQFDPRTYPSSSQNCNLNAKLLEIINKHSMSCMYEDLITIKYEDYDCDEEILKSLLARVDYVLKMMYCQVGIREKCEVQKSNEWFLNRRMYVTASEAKTFFSARTYSNLIYNKLWDEPRSVDHIPAIKWGNDNENIAFEQFKLERNYNVQKCGFFINNKFPGVGCSPDGVILEGDKCVGIIEIKCPYSLRNCKPTEIEGKSVCYTIDGDLNLELKKKHSYYYQVQTSMAILELQWCDFIIWTPGGMLVQRINFDKDFALPLVNKLSKIHKCIVITEFVEMRLCRELPLLIIE